jgi:hypothetical protein
MPPIILKNVINHLYIITLTEKNIIVFNTLC